MNTKIIRFPALSLAVVAMLVTLNAQLTTAHAQGTAFTYQGQLQNNGSPANGIYDLKLLIYDASTNGSILAGPVTNTAVAVTNGLFTTTVDFGAGTFTGGSNWLHLGVRTNGGSGFTGLMPRQQLTPTPYAIYAENASAAGLSGTLPLAQLPGAVVTNNETSVTLGSVAVSGYLTLPFPTRIFAGNISLLYSDLTNLFVGPYAGYYNTTGTGNSAFGRAALEGNTTGSYNTANGAYALSAAFVQNFLTTVSGNTADGAYALCSDETGYNNVAVGYQALYSDTAGYDNVGIGVNTFLTNSAGQQNTAVGTYAFQSMTAGNNNVGLGYYAGHDLISGNNNIYIGNNGSANDNNVIRIGTTGTHTSTFIAGNSLVTGLTVDQTSQNIGNVYSNAMVFGASPGYTGEGIASKRSGTNPDDLEFFTDFAKRMTIDHVGNVWVNNNLTTASLTVSNSITTAGLNAFIMSAQNLSTINANVSGQLAASILVSDSLVANTIISTNLSTGTLTIRGGSDVAEPFLVTGGQVEPGTVMVIDAANPGQLMRSAQAYDTRVAGIISGAGGINPGISLQQDGLLDHGQKLALSGRVYVLADASGGAIKPGDLLTTSSTPGHAMKVSDHLKAQGAILGKAMTALNAGKGMVLVLVTLQ